MTTRRVSSTLPLLIIIVLAIVSVFQTLFPTLIHPGLTLFIVGVVFLVLFVIHWIRESLPLIAGWVLTGFGLSFWLLSFEKLSAFALPLVLFGLGIAFIGIFLTTPEDKLIDSRKWPLVPGLLLMVIGSILALEGTMGRERLWSIMVPLVPSIVAIWYVIEWRAREAIGGGE